MTPDIKSRIDALTPDAGLQHVPAKAGQAEEFHTLVRRSDMHAAIEAVLGARSTAAQPIAEGLLQSACARMLANANWGVAGALSPASKRKDFPSNGWASVKLRDLASVRDTLSAASGDSTPPSEPADVPEVVRKLRDALRRLLDSDPTGSIATATDAELRSAVDDDAADPVVREQAAAVLQGRMALSTVQGDPSGAPRAEPEAVGHDRGAR